MYGLPLRAAAKIARMATAASRMMEMTSIATTSHDHPLRGPRALNRAGSPGWSISFRLSFRIRSASSQSPHTPTKMSRRTLLHAQMCQPFSLRLFSMIAVMFTANPSAKAESYTLPGGSSQPSAEEVIGPPGLAGIYYGHLTRDGHPRQ